MFEAILSALCIMSLSLIGGVFFSNSKLLGKIHTHIVPLAVGVFLGVVFFELLPETFESSHEWGPLIVIMGFLGFYLLSHVLETFHHHHVDDHDTCMHNGAHKLLIGDSIHNIADGIVIASAFMVNPFVGILTTVGIALHEIPQEIAEFSILIHAGCTRNKALLYNFVSASSILIGVLLTHFFAQTFMDYTFLLTGIAAGNLLYIAATDLIPELRHSHREHFKRTFLITILGVAIIGSLITYTHTLIPHEEDAEGVNLNS